jgi:type II secretory pathway component PulJ
LKSPHRLAAQAGLGLIEILVGLVLGLYIVAVATGLLLAQLREQHRRLLETRLQQELRAGLVLIEQELHRSGRWAAPAQGLWQVQANPQPLPNPYAAVWPDSASSPTTGYSYSRDSSENQQVDSTERFGFRIHPSTRALELRLSGTALAPADTDTWQALTDPQVVRLTELSVSPLPATLGLTDRCSLPCPTGSTECPPRQIVRQLLVRLSAQSVADVSLQRSMSRLVHLPNDVLQGRCPTA